MNNLASLGGRDGLHERWRRSLRTTRWRESLLLIRKSMTSIKDDAANVGNVDSDARRPTSAYESCKLQVIY
jgi:hypothetical protein